MNKPAAKPAKAPVKTVTTAETLYPVVLPVAQSPVTPAPADDKQRLIEELASLFEIVNEYERRTIIDRLEKCSWSQTEAAESLHVPLSTLNQKIKRLAITIRKKSDN